ncbi:MULTISPECIES: acyl carrier protein [Streptomyces]|jgi:act minimal PKS acyl carrier protein|uniref:Acyl carrier protein n=2 Tax=Streptomyces bottropensis TaxID=42235 RepID=M3FK69_9ACTN|nr:MULTISPECIES: acyl carrier protein [Streptomyces]AHL46708.1 acyl carrier protein [Streptomyces bottropensis]EMF53325.1 acyl carrier protein [Streptomyces bottropensis ATCC 25435]MZD17360.1 actinorhodin polyketide synthase [Streptomyces sp. SID5476]
MSANGVTALSIDDFTRILRESAGQDEGVDLSGDIADVSFTDLGYDSLALLEVAGRITRAYGVTLPDEDLDGAETPRAFVDLVNSSLSGS